MIIKLTDNLIAIKVETDIYSFAINKIDGGISTLKVSYDNLHDYSILLPKGNWAYVNETHLITATQIEQIGLSKNQYAKLLEDNNINYNYTSWNGKYLLMIDKEKIDNKFSNRYIPSFHPFLQYEFGGEYQF